MLADTPSTKSAILPLQLSTISKNGLSTVSSLPSPSTSSPSGATAAVEAASNVTSTSRNITSNATLKDKQDLEVNVASWTVSDVELWARTTGHFSKEVVYCLRNEEIDGKVLLALCENDIRDMRYRLNYHLSFGDLKKLWLSVYELQERYIAIKSPQTHTNINSNCLINGTCPLLYTHGTTTNNVETTPVHRRNHTDASCYHHSDNRDLHTNSCLLLSSEYIPNVPTGGDSDVMTPPMSIDGRAVNIPPEFFKTFISLGYSFLVTWITSFVMVIVHERVPDMKRYPPLPDIFLDNVPHIPWAFHMCEITGTLLFAIWSCVCIFHKYRMVLLRRFFALAGTVFLLRCVTMLITSLSVPGTHLQCDQSDYAVDDTDLSLTEALELRISRAYTIWSGLGMSIQGVRTCGDYMFSGHTVALTLLNFFITEYTPRNLYFLHTLTWLLNMFGIFFILAAHEHYSIDVFVAFYITSRLFLYYHTLANNQALMSRDSTRTRIWFPMFSYFESSVDGIIPNEFDTVSSLFDGLLRCVIDIKDHFMMTAQRLSVDPPQLALATKNLFLLPLSKEHRHVATSTQSATITGGHGTGTGSVSGSGSVSDNTPTLDPSTEITHDEMDTDTLCESSTELTATLTVNYETANGNATGDVTFNGSPKSSITSLNNNNRDRIVIAKRSGSNIDSQTNENTNSQTTVTQYETKKIL